MRGRGVHGEGTARAKALWWGRACHVPERDHGVGRRAGSCSSVSGDGLVTPGLAGKSAGVF